MNSSKTASKLEPARRWIDGEWVGSSNVAESVSPSTGEVLGQYAAGGRVEAAAAIDAARKDKLALRSAPVPILTAAVQSERTESESAGGLLRDAKSFIRW